MNDGIALQDPDLRLELIEPEGELPSFAGSAEHDFGPRSRAWAAFEAEAKRVGGNGGAAAQSFSATPVHVGLLSAPLAERAYSAMKAAEVESYYSTDAMPDFTSYELPQEVDNSMNRTSAFRKFTPHESWIMDDVLDEMRGEVQAALGAPWRMLNIRAWTTNPESEREGPYGWHSDGLVRPVYKLLVYLTPLSPENGMVELQLDGKVAQLRCARGGAWVLFDATGIVHRGIPGTQKERLLVDMTVARAAATDSRARHAGQNSHWPNYPWVEPLEGWTTEQCKQIAEMAALGPEVFTPPDMKRKSLFGWASSRRA